MAWWIEAKIRKRTKAAVQVGLLVVHHVKCTQKWYIKMWNVFHILMGISKVFYAQILQLFWRHDGISCNIAFSYYANHYNILSPFLFALFWWIYLRIKLILPYQIHAKNSILHVHGGQFVRHFLLILSTDALLYVYEIINQLPVPCFFN